MYWSADSFRFICGPKHATWHTLSQLTISVSHFCFVQVPPHHIKTYQIEKQANSTLESVTSAIHFMVTTQHFLKGQMRVCAKGCKVQWSHAKKDSSAIWQRHWVLSNVLRLLINQSCTSYSCYTLRATSVLVIPEKYARNTYSSLQIHSSNARPTYLIYSKRKSKASSKRIGPELWHPADRTISITIPWTSMAMGMAIGNVEAMRITMNRIWRTWRVSVEKCTKNMVTKTQEFSKQS